MGFKSTLVRRGRRVRHAPMIAWVTWRFVNRILATRPVRTRAATPGAPVELHVLTYHRDWVLALWAVKSFYHRSGADWPLAFHIGGPDEPRMLRGLAEHFPDAEVWTTGRADAHVEPELRRQGLTHLAEERLRSPLMRKVTDFLVTCQGERAAGLDPDVIFFAAPDEFVAAGTTADVPLFMRDRVSAYCVTEEQVRERHGIRMLPKVNTGLTVLPVARLPLKRCDEILAADERFRGARLAEQTLTAVVGSEQGGRHLPDTYRVSEGRTLRTPDGRPVVAKHYTNTPRPDLFREGIAYLATESDLLTVLARPA